MYFTKKDILKMILQEYFINPFKRNKDIEEIVEGETKQQGMHEFDLLVALNDTKMNREQRIYVLHWFKDMYRNMAAKYALKDDNDMETIRRLQTCRHNYELIEKKIDELEYDESEEAA